ncbi:MAG: DNA mismatch repair protein MutS, partial [Sphingobacteriales bacterium]
MDAKRVYADLLSGYSSRAQTLRQQLSSLSLLRLLLFCGFIFTGYKSLVTGSAVFIIVTLILVAAFLVMIRVYDQLQRKTAFYKALVKLNTDEISFLENNFSAYGNGKEYTDPRHPYSYDLDMFGDGGLFPYLNRCSTSFGKEALAQSLLH